MSYEVSWHTPGKIIIDRLYNEITAEDVEETSKLIVEHLRQTQEEVHIIVDCRAATGIAMPPHLNRLQTLLAHYHEENLGWTVFVSGDNQRVMAFIASTLAQLTGMRFRRATTTEEAEEFLQKHVVNRIS